MTKYIEAAAKATIVLMVVLAIILATIYIATYPNHSDIPLAGKSAFASMCLSGAATFTLIMLAAINHSRTCK